MISGRSHSKFKFLQGTFPLRKKNKHLRSSYKYFGPRNRAYDHGLRSQGH